MATTSSDAQALGEKQDQDPLIVFKFDLAMFEHMNPLTKLDILDAVPWVASHFYYDAKAAAYALAIGKKHWDGLKPDARRRFMMVARRIKEETEGGMTTHQRALYDDGDLFDMMMMPGGDTASANEEEDICFGCGRHVCICD